MAPVTFKYSSTVNAIQKRLARLPKLVRGAVDTSLKRDSQNMIRAFQDGIEKNNFSLEPLKAATIRQKIRKGYRLPKSPLYGKGYGAKNSLINALGIRKIKGGYRVYRRRAMHYEAGIPLNMLLAIHEQGATITNGFGRGILIRIPPRPVVGKAFARTMRERRNREPSRKIRMAINLLIRTGRADGFKVFKEPQSEEK